MKISWSFKYRAKLFFFLMLVIQVGFSQNFRFPVVARITQVPPYPVYLQDYANPAQTSLSIQLEVRDNTLPIRNIKLKLYLNGPNGMIISRPVVQNEKVIQLSAGQFYDLPSSDVANYFQSYNLQISAQEYSKSIVDGTYQFGVEVIDAITNKPLSSVQYGPPVWLVVNEPPILFTPDNEVSMEALTPQNITFQWVPRHKNISDVSYEFSLVEINMPLTYAGNVQNLFFAQPPIFTEITTQTQLNYDFSKPPLIPGRFYAYRVQAKAKEGLGAIGMFRNNGFSEVHWFRYLPSLLPAFNTKAQRVGDRNISVNWSGYDNHSSYLFNYRQVGEASWKEMAFERNNAIIGENLFQKEYTNLDQGKYEFRIGAKSAMLPQTVFSDVFYLLDSTDAPVNLTSSWKDSTSALLRWEGSQMHKAFRVEYKSVIGEIWRSLPTESAIDYSISEDFFVFGTVVQKLDDDSSYIFRVIGYDFENFEKKSNESYLRKKDEPDPLVILKEKAVVGRMLWAFAASEESFGRTNGDPAFATNSAVEGKVISRRHDLRAGSRTQPLENMPIEVFADRKCSVLLKSITTNKFGDFKITFPAEALRGGELPDSVYLRFSNSALGRLVRAIYTKNIIEEYNIGDINFTVNSFRLKVTVKPIGGFESIPSEHNIKVYRRASYMSSLSYLKYENFRSTENSEISINNEKYVQIGELKSGQVLGGMFYSARNPSTELLLELTGPVPYKKTYSIYKSKSFDGVMEQSIQMTQGTTEPYFYGTLSYQNGKKLNPAEFRMQLYAAGGIYLKEAFVDNNSNYRLHIPVAKYDRNKPYAIKVLHNNILVEQVELYHLPLEEGTEQNFVLKSNLVAGVALKLNNDRFEPLAKVKVEVNGLKYETNAKGWLCFTAPVNSISTLKIQQVGHHTFTKSFVVKPQAERSISSILYAASSGNTLKNEVAKDLRSALDNISVEGPNPFYDDYDYASLSNIIYGRVFSSMLTERTSYGGVQVNQITDNSEVLSYDLAIRVLDFQTRKPIRGVKVNLGKLDYLGITNAAGELLYKARLGSGNLLFDFSPEAGLKNVDGQDYGQAQAYYQIPGLSSTTKGGTLEVLLEAGALIRGIVYKMGTTMPLANTKVTIEFPGISQVVETNASGEYRYRFNPTVEENFLAISAEKSGYYKRTVYMATAKSYGTLYNRDIYLNPGVDDILEPEKIGGVEVGMLISLWGYKVLKTTSIISGGREFTPTEMKAAVLNASSPVGFKISGEFADNEGRLYQFDGAELSLKISTTDKGLKYVSLEKVLKDYISVNTRKENKVFFNTIAMAEEEPLYLGPIYPNIRNTNDLKKGVIYWNNLKPDPRSLTEELGHVIEGNSKSGGYTSLVYNVLLPNYVSVDNQINGSRAYPLTTTLTETPMEKIEMFSGKDFDNEAYTDAMLYYTNVKASSDKIRSDKFIGSRVNSGMFYFNNVLFKSFSITPRGPQINKVTVMPITSMTDIFIDHMNIDFVRLSKNKIQNILIDYSYSPRKLSMGQGVVKAQIQEVYVEAEGVDVVYFTNVGENSIDLKDPNMTPINYNANGIFYANYKNQKEIVQTAAVLNEVNMYGIPEPAMGPGNRIKISAVAGNNAKGTGGIQSVLEHAPRYAYNGQIPLTSSYDDEASAPTLKLEGEGNITLDPHIIKTFWKYNKDRKDWKVRLTGHSPLYSDKPWGKIYWPNSINVNIADSADVSLYTPNGVGKDSLIKGPTKVNFAELKNASIEVLYGINIPALANMELNCSAQWDPDSTRFRRTTTTGKFSVGFPDIVELKVGLAILMNSAEKVSGVFIAGEVVVQPIGGGGSIAGGYACVERSENSQDCDQIWGFTLSASAEDGLPPSKTSPFKLYNLKLGFLHDKISQSNFFQIGTTLGIGKKMNFDSTFLQLLPDAKKDSTSKAKAKNKAADEVSRLETTKSKSQRDNDLNQAKSKTPNLENELSNAKSTMAQKKRDLEDAQTLLKTKEKEFDKIAKEKSKADADFDKLKTPDLSNRELNKTTKEADKLANVNNQSTKETELNNLRSNRGSVISAYEAKNIEIRNNTELLDENKSKVKKYESKSSEAERETELNSKNQEKTNKTNELDNLTNNDLKDADEELQRKTDHLNNLKGNPNADPDAVKQAEEEKKQAEKDKSEVENKINKLDQEVNDLADQITTKRDELLELKNSKQNLNDLEALLTQQKRSSDSLRLERNRLNDKEKTVSDEIKTLKKDGEKLATELEEINEGIKKYKAADSTKNAVNQSYTNVLNQKKNLDSLKNVAVGNLQTAEAAVTVANDSLAANKRDIKTYQNEVDEYTAAEKVQTKTSEISDAANMRKAKSDSIDANLKKLYSKTDADRYTGAKKFGLETLFVVVTGRSPWDAKGHAVAINNAEFSLAVGSSGWTFTGAGELSLQNVPLLDIAFLMSAKNSVSNSGNSSTKNISDWRVFIAMPQFYRPKVGAIYDLTLNAQLDFGGRANEDTTKLKPNFLLMAAVSGTIQPHPIVYVNASMKLAFAINTETNQEKLEADLSAGATLSQTARKIVKFMGSSFNDITENAVEQRMGLFRAIPVEYLSEEGTFSGLYVGAKASVMIGRVADFEVPKLFSGSFRVGAGLELSMGVLKSIGNGSWQFRLAVNPLIELDVRMRKPIEAILLDLRVDWLSKFCLTTGYNSQTDKHYVKLLYTIIKTDKVIGFPTIPESQITCNQFGMFFAKPCIFVYIRSDSTEPDNPKKNGFFVDTVLDEDPTAEICPIEW